MKKTLLLTLSFVFVGIAFAQTYKAQVPLTNNEEDIYLLDSIHVYTASENVTSKVFMEYENNLEVFSELYKIEEEEEFKTAYDSTYYDINDRIILYKYFAPIEGEFVCKRYEETSYTEAGLIENIKEYTYSELTEEYDLTREETYTYNEEGYLLERVTSILNTGPVGPPTPPQPPMFTESALTDVPPGGGGDGESRTISRSVFSDYIEIGKPGKEELYEFGQERITSYIIYEYDDKKNLSITTNTRIDLDDDGEPEETLQGKTEYSYNDLSQVTEIINSYLLIGVGLSPEEKTVYSYNAETNLLEKEENFLYARWLTEWQFESKLIYFWNKRIPTSICHKEQINNMTVYYQRAGKQIVIEGDMNINNVELYNIEGHVLLTSNNGESTSNYSINTSDLPAGIYLVRIIGDNKNIVKKVMIHE